MATSSHSNHIVITVGSLICKIGWTARHVEKIALNRLDEVVPDQTVTGRVLKMVRWRLRGPGEGCLNCLGGQRNAI